MISRKSVVLTYVKIFIVLVIIAVIIYAAVQFFGTKYNEEEFETLKTDMLLIQGKIEVVSQKVDIEEEDAEYIGTSIKENKEDEKIQNLINNNIIDIDSKKSKYYCINNDNLNELGLENVRVDDYYIVDYENNEVIYINGIKNENGDTIYKLSDM